MYEIWLAANILWEFALEYLAWLVLAAVLWIGLTVLAVRRDGDWREAWPTSLALAAGVAVIAFLAVPTLTRSSLAELNYWVDWANLLMIAVGVGAAALAFLWPALALRATRHGY